MLPSNLVLVRRAAIQFLRGFEHHARRMIDATAIAAEIDAIDYSALSIRPEFIDANGHLNVGYYTLLFDNALDLAWARLGIYSGLILASGYSSFALETHMTYQRELKLGDLLDFSLLLLDFDAKRIHYFLTMRRALGGGDLRADFHLRRHEHQAQHRLARGGTGAHHGSARCSPGAASSAGSRARDRRPTPGRARDWQKLTAALSPRATSASRSTYGCRSRQVSGSLECCESQRPGQDTPI